MKTTQKCIVVRDGKQTIAEYRYDTHEDLMERIHRLGWAFDNNYEVKLKWGKVEESIDIMAYRYAQN